MYYPKQIPYLLNSEFQKQVEYHEYHFKELEHYCMCIWQMTSKEKLKKPIYNYILPDACVDIIIDFTQQSIFFAAFSKDTELFLLHDDVDYLGVRLKPGAFYAIFGIHAEKIMDHQIPFSDLEIDPFFQDIFLVSIEERISFFRNYLTLKIKFLKENKMIQIIDELYLHPQEKKVYEISKQFGYQERQLNRIFKKHYGVSPKVLLNILRLHLCLNVLLEGKQNLSDIALFCGFYDQSHFIKEIKRYTKISPFQMMEQMK